MITALTVIPHILKCPEEDEFYFEDAIGIYVVCANGYDPYMKTPWPQARLISYLKDEFCTDWCVLQMLGAYDR